MKLITDEEIIKKQPDYVKQQEDINIGSQFTHLPWKPNLAANPELDNNVMKAIVRCRRFWAPEENMLYIDTMFKEHFDSHYKLNWNSRWLLSIVDTYAESGSTPIERANALIVTSIITHAKILESYLLMVNDPTFNKEKFLASKSQTKLWDGFLTVQLAFDDVMNNFAIRMEKSFIETPIIGKLFKELLKRIVDSRCAYGMTCIRHNSFLYGLEWDVDDSRSEFLKEHPEWTWKR